MNRKFCFFLWVITTVFYSLGCAKLPYQRETARKDVKSLQVRLDSIQKITNQISIGSGASKQADILILLKEIKEKLSVLQLKLDATEHRIKKFEQIFLNSQRSKKRTKKQKKSFPPQTTIHIEKVYHQAREDYITGKYNLALKGFKTVANQPKGSYTERSLYWTGESFYKLKQYDKAFRFYKIGIKIYPKGQKVCTNLYKMGKILDLQQKTQEKQQTWKKLIKKPQCKNSNEALRVKDLLNL